MKLSTIIIALTLPLASANTLADDYICSPITGKIQQLQPDPACAVLLAKPKHFTDIIFLPSSAAAPTCFASTLTATIGNRAVSGTVSSGLTLNDQGQLTAASAIHFNAGTVELGDVYTTDIVFDADNPAITTELLTMVDGRKTFKDGHGHFKINGNALFSPTTFSGTLCVEN
ncbi:MAG: hypothetical protein LUQ11_16105 [Methylococcaceae bacterium]|nr:hypothetical protein [Methylococcaceae bacterium]